MQTKPKGKTRPAKPVSANRRQKDEATVKREFESTKD